MCLSAVNIDAPTLYLQISIVILHATLWNKLVDQPLLMNYAMVILRVVVASAAPAASVSRGSNGLGLIGRGEFVCT